MTDTLKFETLIYEKERGRARITLNRPEKLNALSRQIQAELKAALWDADQDDRVHSIILRGAGRSFCAGYDLTPARTIAGESGVADGPYLSQKTIDNDAWRMEDAQRDRLTIQDMHKPVIGQVHGYCVAGGTDLVFLCDIVVAAKDAQIGFPAVRGLGSPPQHMWTYHVGPQWAKYMLLTGDLIDGETAERIGLVWKAVNPEDLAETVEDLADKMAMIHPDLLSANKRTVNLALELMGQRTLQRIAAEVDARTHVSPAMDEWAERMAAGGLKEALEWRDSRFSNPIARRAWQAERWPEGPRPPAN